MAQRTNPNSPMIDPLKRHPGCDELFKLMSELVSLRKEVAQAEFEAMRCGSASTNANRDNAAAH